MKRIDISKLNPENTYYDSDCEIIVNVAQANGWSINKSEAHSIWSEHSDSMAAGWLFLPDNDNELYRDIAPYLERCEVAEATQ